MSSDAINHQVRLAARPVGLPKRSDWQFTETPMPKPGDREVLVRTLYLSLDPAMRGWMNEGRSYIPPVGIGEVMRAGGIGRVVASNHPDFAVGDHVNGTLGVQDYAVLEGRPADQGRSQARPAAGLSQHARHARHDRLFRPARCRPAEARRYRRRLGRRRRSRRERRPDRQDQRMPRGRYCRRRRQMPLSGR